MSGRGKRIWAPQISFDDAYQEALHYLKRCQEHKLLGTPEKPELIYAYRLSQPLTTQHGSPISPVLKFGHDSDPLSDQLKVVIAKLASVALKIHYFQHPTLFTAHEPYWFAIPDISQPHRQQYALVYTLQNQEQTFSWVISTWDIAQSAKIFKKFDAQQKFPSVLTTDSYQWLSIKRWKALKEQQTNLDLHQETQKESYKAGHILDYHPELNAELKALGAIWARGIKKWVFPKGFDIQAIKDYLQWIESMSPQERYQHRWVKQMDYPKPVVSYGKASGYDPDQHGQT